jgi:tetratricopeptide (TPR) repeat protein
MSESFDATFDIMEEPRMQDPDTLLLAELNNEGAFHIGCGELDEAIRVFTKAREVAARGTTTCTLGSEDEEELPIMSEVLAPASRNLEQVVVAASESHAHAPSSSKSDRGRTRNRPQHKCTTTTTTQQKSTSEDCTSALYQDFIYDKPIRVMDRYNTPSHAEVSLYVVYNLALCHHLKALARKHVSERRLRRILKLYKLAYSLQVKAAEDHTLSASHAIAILNNVAQVYKNLGRRKKSERCLQNLLTNLVRLIDQLGSSDRRGLADQVDQLDGFLLNISHLVLSKSNVAPAA